MYNSLAWVCVCVCYTRNQPCALSVSISECFFGTKHNKCMCVWCSKLGCIVNGGACGQTLCCIFCVCGLLGGGTLCDGGAPTNLCMLRIL